MQQQHGQGTYTNHSEIAFCSENVCLHRTTHYSEASNMFLDNECIMSTF